MQFFIISTILLISASAQSIFPSNPCLNYFQYVFFGNKVIGKITLQPEQIKNQLQVQFSQRVPLTFEFAGKLSLFDDETTVQANLLSGRPISYRIDFPTPGVLPKLTSIQLNGNIICQGNEYPAPSTTISLMHTLQLSRIIVNRAALPERNILTPKPQGSYLTSESTLPDLMPGTFSLNNPFFKRSKPSSTVSTQQASMLAAATFSAPTIEPTATVAPASPSPSSLSSSSILPSFIQSTLMNGTQQYQRNLSANTCGQEGNNIIPFIYMGSILTHGQLPWLTAIYQKQTGAGLKFLCGGSLISRSTVITAAHCFKIPELSANRVLIYLGRHNLDDYSENGTEVREVQELLLHPEYDSNRFSDADIALLHLKQPIVFTKFIQPICLWSEAYGMMVPVGQKGYVAGWGGDENGAVITNLPKIVDASIVSEAECLRSLKFNDLVTSHTICAGNNNNSGPCMGDSGGGLMLKINNKWVLRGIVSAGEIINQRCNLDKYVIYCDVANHITWVREHIKD